MSTLTRCLLAFISGFVLSYFLSYTFGLISDAAGLTVFPGALLGMIISFRIVQHVAEAV